MGITGLLPFIEKASRRTNISEFNGCTVAIDSYCWLHKGAFACADKLVRGENTDVHIKYCLKYVNMLLSKNLKPILVFDGRHLPAKAMTESKRRESRNISKKRAAELLSLGKMEEARSYMRRCVDITHEMALQLIQECRKRNIDCIVAPYEADAQLAYLNIKNIAHVVITEDSDLILFGCTKVLFKMDLDGTGTLVETAKLPLVMKCPIEQYSFSKFRQMCVMSGCDYLASLPGIGLAKARQFVTATQDSNFANALRKLPSFFNRANLTVTDEYRENFLKAEATFKHQYVYDPLERQMVRLTDPDDEDIEKALCVNAGELLDVKVAFELALGNLDPFTLKKMDSWHPDNRPTENNNIKSSNWAEKVADHPSIWNAEFKAYLDEPTPWQKRVKVNVSAFTRRPTRRVVNLVSKVVPETEDQDESLSIKSLSNMYCMEPETKRLKPDESKTHLLSENETKSQKAPSPILKNKERSFKKGLKNGGYNILKKLSRFPRTVIDDNVVESKFFSTKSTSNIPDKTVEIFDSPEKTHPLEEYVDKNNTDSGIFRTCSGTLNTSSGTLNTCSGTLNTSDIANKANISIIIEESPVKSKNPFKKSTERKNTSNNSTIIEDDIKNDTKDRHESMYEDSQKETSLMKTSPILLPSPSRNAFSTVIEDDIKNDTIDSDETMCEDSQKENSPMKTSPILLPSPSRNVFSTVIEDDIKNDTIDSDESMCEDSQKENSPMKTSPILLPSPRRNVFNNVVKRLDQSWSEDTVIENTYPMETLVTPVDSQESFGQSPPKPALSQSRFTSSQPIRNNVKKSTCRVPGLKRTTSLPSNQPTLLSKFGFQKKPALRR